MSEAVILVPGIMGSVLKDGNKVVWPGSPLELFLPYGHMLELLKTDLEATDVIRNVSISSQYQDLIEALGNCGFSETSKPATLKVFPYDWRKDNSLAAQALADCVDAMSQTLGEGAEISLVAHSMGGLVSRFYLESGDFSTRSGFACVRRLITLGTPHLGAPMALAAALGQEKRVFLNAEQVRRVANDPRFPSLYQLLPPRGEPFAWNRAGDARFAPVDIYDSEVASRLELEQANLVSAQWFHAKLSLDRRPAHVRYFFFVGTRQQTTSSVQVTLSAAAGARVVKIDRDDSGDGTVPTWSGSLSGVQVEPVGGEHGELYKNIGLKRTLGVLLGKPGVLLAEGLRPEISVRHKVIEPNSLTNVTLDFPRGTKNVTGELRLEKRTNAKGDVLPKPVPSSVYPIEYSGAQIDHLTVVIEAPNYPGAYELTFVPKDGDESLVSTELLVQAA